VHYEFPLLEQFAVSAVFRGEPAPTEEIVRSLQASRQSAEHLNLQPSRVHFQNPDSCPRESWWMSWDSEFVRWKGAGVEVHGNFINDGGATALGMLN
jgi:hypothetical protein